MAGIPTPAKGVDASGGSDAVRAVVVVLLLAVMILPRGR